MKTNLLLLCVVLTGCQAVVGSGTVTTTTRDVSAFRRVAVSSGIELSATTGARALTITADDNLQPLIETLVQGDTLVIRLQELVLLTSPVRTMKATLSNDLFEGLEVSGGVHATLPATATTTFPIAASGGSQVEITGLSSTEFTIEASGASTVKVSGAASRGTVAASGGSHLELTQVPLESLRVDASGASLISARVSSALTGSASGASTITIVGTPSNQVDLSGGSRVDLGAL